MDQKKIHNALMRVVENRKAVMDYRMARYEILAEQNMPMPPHGELEWLANDIVLCYLTPYDTVEDYDQKVNEQLANIRRKVETIWEDAEHNPYNSKNYIPEDNTDTIDELAAELACAECGCTCPACVQ